MASRLENILRVHERNLKNAKSALKAAEKERDSAKSPRERTLKESTVRSRRLAGCSNVRERRIKGQVSCAGGEGQALT